MNTFTILTTYKRNFSMMFFFILICSTETKQANPANPESNQSLNVYFSIFEIFVQHIYTLIFICALKFGFVVYFSY